MDHDFGKLSHDDLGGDILIGGDTADSVMVVNNVPSMRIGYAPVLDGGGHFQEYGFWVHDLVLSFSGEQIDEERTEPVTDGKADDKGGVWVHDLVLSGKTTFMISSISVKRHLIL